ncbi:hypothetical protein NM688_g7590 [Phlebia brevispora]|uniref:Uncharacterized protein n=1 Tax=Phlebia brevispora TaxID=194682 RepID=A0ACC1S3H4_9APHY|nr:hypothetical protein NM688_g7590 [Phlebia brevispora]
MVSSRFFSLSAALAVLGYSAVVNALTSGSGDNWNWTLCGEQHCMSSRTRMADYEVDTSATYAITVDDVTVDPSLVAPNIPVTIVASLETSEIIEDGAYLNVGLSFNGISLPPQSNIQLCSDQVAGLTNLTCPISEGPFTLTTTVLPQGPPGQYHLQADSFTKDDDSLLCVEIDWTMY